jgi:hypothetical protein
MRLLRLPVQCRPLPMKIGQVSEIDGIAMPTYMSWLGLTYRPTMALACAGGYPLRFR